jgi:hypothetical protein
MTKLVERSPKDHFNEVLETYDSNILSMFILQSARRLLQNLYIDAQ